MLEYASLLIAFFATAGAIPLCRSLAAARRKGETAGAVFVAPKVVGIAILLGILLSLFYLGAGELPILAPVLAAMAAVAVAATVHRRLAPAPFRDAHHRRECAASLAAGTVVLLSATVELDAWRAGSLALAAMALLTPMAISMLGRLNPGAPGLPVGVALIQLLLLVALALTASGEVPDAQRLMAFPSVALPVIGALTAALVYLCRMPWRERAAVSAGTATRICLGLLVAWAALWMGDDPTARPELTAALSWSLALPVCELVRRTVLPTVAYPQLAVAGCTLAFGSLGLAALQLRTSSTWAMALLLASAGAYCLVPMFRIVRGGSSTQT